MDDINEPPQELVTWRQSKFDKLSATKAAVTLLAHSANEVQFEAMQLLEELLRVRARCDGVFTPVPLWPSSSDEALCGVLLVVRSAFKYSSCVLSYRAVTRQCRARCLRS